MAPSFPVEDDRLLIQAATLEGHQGRRSWDDWRARHSIENAHGAAHELLPLIYWTLRPWPAHDKDAGLLKGMVRFTWSCNRLEIERLAGVLKLLSRRSIRPVLVDGVAMALGHYPHLGLRRIERLRLLVDPGDVAGAVKSLETAGLRRAARPGTRRRLELLDDSGRGLELEWNDERRNGAAPNPGDRPFWRTVDVAGVDGLLPGPTWQLLRVLSRIESGGDAARILPIIDARRLLDSSPNLIDWHQILDTIESSVSLGQAPAALAYLQRILYAPVPARWLARLATIRPGSRASWRARLSASARRRLPLAGIRRRR